ncbi:MAG: hypothetical protein ACK56I_10275, partial [bacterium]
GADGPCHPGSGGVDCGRPRGRGAHAAGLPAALVDAADGVGLGRLRPRGITPDHRRADIGRCSRV